MKNFFDELTDYRVKVERDGKEIVNVPGILALPGLLVAPKMSIIGIIAAPLLGCNIHLENQSGKVVDVGEAVKQAAETVVDTAKTAARTIREEVDKAWEEMSAADPAEDAGEADPETEDASGEDIPEDPEKTEDIPTIRVDSDDSEKE